MLIGHYAPALALQRSQPSVKLWQLFIATQFVDILWGLCVLVGIERVRIVPGFNASNDLDLYHMPYTHSAVATLAWMAAAFVLWRGMSRAETRTRDAVIIALAVGSHWLGDLLVHVQDLPLLTGDGEKLGFGLWRHRWLALCVETGLFALAALYWWLPRRGQPGAGRAAFALLGLTALAAASYFIATPPNPTAMALTGLATYAGVAAFAAWFEGLVATARPPSYPTPGNCSRTG